MKYIVKNAERNANQIAGIEPYDPNMKDDYIDDYIEADIEDEAIELAIDYIIEHSDLLSERTDDGILFYESFEDEPVLEFYGFRATVYNGQC